MKRNAGIVGPNQEPAPNRTTGIYDLYDQYNSTYYDLWTRSAGYNSITYDRGGDVLEGDTLVFNVSTVGVSNNTRVWWFLFNIDGVSGTDFSDGQTSGSFLIKNGLGSFSRTLVTTDGTEGQQSFRIQLREQNNVNAAVVLQTGVIRILEPTVTITNPSSINEGQTLTFNITTVDFPSGSLNYKLVWVSGAQYPTDVDQFEGSVSVVNSAATASFQIFADGFTEGTETIRLECYINNNLAGQSSVVSIIDTSTGGTETTDVMLYGAATDNNYVKRTTTYLEFQGFFDSNLPLSPFSCMFAWRTLMSNVPATCSAIQVFDSTNGINNVLFSTTDITNRNGICGALRNGTNFTGNAGWRVFLGCVNSTNWSSYIASGGTTGGVTNNTTDANFARYLTVNGTGCSCDSGVTVFTIRPHIANTNWGGWQSTCGSSARFMRVRFVF